MHSDASTWHPVQVAALCSSWVLARGLTSAAVMRSDAATWHHVQVADVLFPCRAKCITCVAVMRSDAATWNPVQMADLLLPGLARGLISTVSPPSAANFIEARQGMPRDLILMLPRGTLCRWLDLLLLGAARSLISTVTPVPLPTSLRHGKACPATSLPPPSGSRRAAPAWQRKLRGRDGCVDTTLHLHCAPVHQLGDHAHAPNTIIDGTRRGRIVPARRYNKGLCSYRTPFAPPYLACICTAPPVHQLGDHAHAPNTIIDGRRRASSYCLKGVQAGALLPYSTLLSCLPCTLLCPTQSLMVRDVLHCTPVAPSYHAFHTLLCTMLYGTCFSS